jgi:hypothetical protein
MESRKRPRGEDADVLQSKKRAVSDTRDPTVSVNSVPDSSEPRDSDSLEVNEHFSPRFSGEPAVKVSCSCSERMLYSGR